MLQRLFFIYLIAFGALHGANTDSLISIEQQLAGVQSPFLYAAKPAIDLDELLMAIAQAKALFHQELMYASWHESETAFEPYQAHPAHLFCQKIIVPEATKIAFFGDLHGNIHGFLTILRDLIAKNFLDSSLTLAPNNCLFFLGDYVDRGQHGAEILYLIALLKQKNPLQVFCVRGNHEDARLNSYYGFNEELQNKYPAITSQEIAAIQELYDYMPSALYLGIQAKDRVNYIQCCHGGLEIGYNPQALLASNDTYETIKCLNRASNCALLPSAMQYDILRVLPHNEYSSIEITEPTRPVMVGLMWHDFMEADAYGNAVVAYNQGRGWVYGKKLTNAILAQQSSDAHSIKAIFRAHQHHGGMLTMLNANKGMVSLWDGLVYTFLPLPIAPLHNSFSSYGLLTVEKSYKKSSLEHIVVA